MLLSIFPPSKINCAAAGGLRCSVSCSCSLNRLRLHSAKLVMDNHYGTYIDIYNQSTYVLTVCHTLTERLCKRVTFGVHQVHSSLGKVV